MLRSRTYQCDIHEKKIVADCNLYPTDILKSECPWLYARNNKHENVNPSKVGKWMLFIPKDSVNAIWDKVKVAVANGELWDSKVSTTDPDYSSHAIMIYTKDYTDLNDIISTLNYLESSGIKSPHVTSYYKTDQQTHAGIYSGGQQRPWIYASDTIRETGLSSTSMYSYQFDIHEQKTVTDCNLYPTDILKSDCPWLHARNNKYENVDPNKVGKWMLFLSEDKVNAAWDKVKAAVASGELWNTKVSTTDFDQSSYAIMIYTKDYTDVNDVISTHNYLESSGIKPPEVTMYYKTDAQTRAGVYSGSQQRPWIYSSFTILEASLSST